MINSNNTKKIIIMFLILIFPIASYAININVTGTLGDLDGDGDNGAAEDFIVQTAESCWELRITTNRDYDLSVAGVALCGFRGLGGHTGLDENNDPNQGFISIDNDGTTTWFVDPSPFDSTEYSDDPFSQWRFTNGPNQADLMSVVFHEFGHALGWICGESCANNPPGNTKYDGLLVPDFNNFVSGPLCTSPFPLAGDPELPGCVRLTWAPDFDIPVRGDGLGGSGSSVVNELSHPGVRGDLMHGLGRPPGDREILSVTDVDMYNHAYGDSVNLPPTVNAGPTITQECDAIGGSNITLDASGSTDLEGDPLIYSWNCTGVALNNASTDMPDGFFQVNTFSRCRVDATDIAECPPDADIVDVTVLDTTDPNITCPDDITKECSETGGTPDTDPEIAAFLNGVNSSDICDAAPSIFENAPSHFNLGTTEVQFAATDESGNTSSCTATVTIEDTTDPIITCPDAITVECSATGGTPADDDQLVPFFSGVSATDVCDADPVITDDAPSLFPLGDTTVEFNATDDSNNSSTCTEVVSVEDTTPPDITNVTASPDVLWPPNHKMRQVDIDITATDICDDTPTCQVISVSSDEPINGLGDGDSSPDWEITGPESVSLRAERSGGGDGRVYTITVECSDDSGNSSEATVDVSVPLDQTDIEV